MNNVLCFRIACISCPTLFQRLVTQFAERVVLLEYDIRFEHYSSFIHYDYNFPLNLPTNLKQSFDLVIVDPPFLADECLEKVALTVHFLAKNRILLCTGKFVFF